jgi:hypothetical protein
MVKVVVAKIRPPSPPPKVTDVDEVYAAAALRWAAAKRANAQRIRSACRNRRSATRGCGCGRTAPRAGEPELSRGGEIRTRDLVAPSHAR